LLCDVFIALHSLRKYTTDQTINFFTNLFIMLLYRILHIFKLKTDFSDLFINQAFKFFQLFFICIDISDIIELHYPLLFVYFIRNHFVIASYYL